MSNNWTINHLWIIMDWNRRWAKSQSMNAIAWHKKWADNVVKVTELAKKKGIKYLTLWVLSTDNLNKRSFLEVEWIFKLLNWIEWLLWKMLDENLKLETIWNIEKLPEKTQWIINKVKEKTKNNNGITLILALIYGWQDEIIRTTQKIIKSWIEPEKLTKQEFRKFSDTWKFPVVDMIVRTGWDVRHSWFMLFDSEYSEYYFSSKKWPEFDWRRTR